MKDWAERKEETKRVRKRSLYMQIIGLCDNVCLEFEDDDEMKKYLTEVSNTLGKALL